MKRFLCVAVLSMFLGGCVAVDWVSAHSTVVPVSSALP
jgi:hypothetical protein